MQANEIDISSWGFSQKPFGFYEQLRSEGSVHYLEKNNTWLIIGFDEIVEVLNNPKVFTSEGSHSFDPILLNCDPPKHTKNRKILAGDQAIFSSSRVSKLEQTNRNIADRLLQQIKDKTAFDLLKDFALPFSSLVILDLLGLKVEEHKELKSWSQSAVSNQSIHDREYANKQWESLKPIIKKWIENSKKNPENPGINEFIFHPHAIENFTTDDVLNLTKVLLLGGNETTPNLVSSAILLLFKNPELLDKIKSQPNLIELVINETLRLEAPTQIIQRTCLAETVIGDSTLPKGSLISLAIAAGNRDPKVFENPESFNIFRDKGKILSFGFGPHYCLGAQLSRQEAKISLELLLHEFPDLDLVWNQSFEYRNSSHVRGLKELILRTSRGNKRQIDKVKEQALELLKSTQLASGEFPTKEYYPNNETLKEKGWHCNTPSPFVHANILYVLQNINSKGQFYLQIESGVKFIQESKEKGDVWRFWKIQPGINNVPADIDDTSICSFVLTKHGVRLKNSQLFAANVLKSGAIKTWFLPNSTLLFKRPRLFFRWLREKKFYRPTLNSGMFGNEDFELGVMSNVLMYLGENDSTQKTIDFCIDSWKSGSDQQHFYSNVFVTSYHIARAYKEGVTRFILVGESIEKLIVKNLEYLKFTELILAGLSLMYFERNENLRETIKGKITNICCEQDFVFPDFEYFTSKDRNYVAGSPILVGCWFLELSEKWEA